jgi:hypothetical protein
VYASKSVTLKLVPVIGVLEIDGFSPSKEIEIRSKGFFYL